jgi:hypothetical protein
MMKKQKELDRLTRELVKQMMDRSVDDVQDADYQIAYYYLSKAMNYIPNMMKKQDLIKQLANRINQPHVIESWINKIEKASYEKGLKDAQAKQLNLSGVSQQRELLEGFVDWFNANDKTQAILSERIEEYLKNL